MHRMPTAQKRKSRPKTLGGGDAATPRRARSLPQSAARTSCERHGGDRLLRRRRAAPVAAARAARGRRPRGRRPHDDDHDATNALFPLLDLLERFPDLFAQKVLAHLDPIDRTFLAQTGSTCRAAVAASDLPRAGIREEVLGRSVWVVTHRLEGFCTSVELLAWAKSNGCPWVARTCAIAARGGRLDVLQYARANYCPWDEWTCACAAKGWHLEVLKWAWEHHCPWVSSESTCNLAAGGGHLAVLQWARERHLPWNSDTSYLAALRGHLEVLRWAREHDCPWSKRDCERASSHHPETLAWVRAQPY